MIAVATIRSPFLVPEKFAALERGEVLGLPQKVAIAYLACRDSEPHPFVIVFVQGVTDDGQYTDVLWFKRQSTGVHNPFE